MLGVGFGEFWPRALWERQVARVGGGVPRGERRRARVPGPGGLVRRKEWLSARRRVC